MKDEVEARLAQLKQEYRMGEGRLQELVRQEAGLRETLLRMSGAIQVLEEVLESAGTPAAPAPAPAPAPGEVLTVS